jgi:DNA-binding Lrp family transcriptional regulator
MTKAPSPSKWQIIRRFQAVLRRFRSEGKLTLGEAHALAVLPEFMGDDGAMFPSHEAMAEKSGACRRTVINALNRAYALGIVKHTPRYVYDRELGKRVRTSNAYEIVLSGIQQVAQAARYFMRRVRDHLSARPAQERPFNHLLRAEPLFQPPKMSNSDMIEWCLKVAKAT